MTPVLSPTSALSPSSYRDLVRASGLARFFFTKVNISRGNIFPRAFWGCYPLQTLWGACSTIGFGLGFYFWLVLLKRLDYHILEIGLPPRARVTCAYGRMAGGRRLRLGLGLVAPSQYPHHVLNIDHLIIHAYYNPESCSACPHHVFHIDHRFLPHYHNLVWVWVGGW
jgi:hypothetical protein